MLHLSVAFALEAVNLGSGGTRACPCISTWNRSSFLSADGNSVEHVVSETTFELPLTYGVGCQQHDLGLQPSCSNIDCSPSWCSEQWCWVDSANCNESDATGSSYFPGGPIYSYAACGSVDRYSGFYNLLSTTPRTTNLHHPLVSATSCMELTSTSDACGPLVEGRQTFNNDWCALKQQVESGALAFEDVLRGATLDVTIIPAGDAYWVEDATGGRLPGLTQCPLPLCTLH